MSDDTLLSRLVERMQFDNLTANALLEVELANADVARMHALLERAEDLSATDREELAVYLLVEEFLKHLYAKASAQLG